MGEALNNDQLFAVRKLDHWWHSASSQQTISLGGGPGTGKSYTILYLIRALGLDLDEVLFVSYMGKAVSRMIQTGLPAKTIHATCYTYEKEYVKDSEGNILYNSNGIPRTIFVPILKDKLPRKIKLIVADEAYTIPEKNAIDLESFGLPIIAVGDENQLEPPFGRPYFMKNGADIKLNQIMRQAEGNPIIWLAQQVLNREYIKEGSYGTSSVIRKSNLTDFTLRSADIILTSTNKLRGSINDLFRKSFMPFSNLDIPHVGEKLICRANDWSKYITIKGSEIYLTNGTTGFVDYIDKRSRNSKSMKIDFRPDYDMRSFHNLKIDLNRLNGPLGQQDSWTPPDMNSFEYGYALTIYSCLPLNTLIYTEDGIQPLGELKNYTGKIFNGAYWEKPKMYIDNGIDIVNNYVTDLGVTYSVTDNHKCKVLTPYGIITKFGRSLDTDDTLLLRKGQNLYIDNEFVYEFDNSRLFSDLNVRSKLYRLPEQMSYDLALLIGMICADGTITKNNSIVYVKSDKHTCEVYSEVVRKIFGYDAPVNKVIYENAYKVSISSALIWSFFRSIDGLQPNDKFVPKCILKSSTKYQCAFMRGLFEDGTVHLKNGIFDMIVLAFKSHKMISQLSAMLSNIGIRPKITLRQKYTEKGTPSLLYNIQIYKHGGLIFKDLVGFVNEDKQTCLNTINSSYERECYSELASIMIYNWKRPIPDIVRNVIHSGSLTPYAWNKIRSYAIEKNTLNSDIITFIDAIINNFYLAHIKGKYLTKEPTACFEMPETHVFVQNCILGGNSQGSQWDNVLILDEGAVAGVDKYYRSLYVAITRAVKSVTIAR